MQYVIVNPETKSRGAGVLSYQAAVAAVAAGAAVGFILEENLYLLDLDAEQAEGRFIAEYIVREYPNIICFKTPKAGGYHFLFRSPVKLRTGVGFMTIFGFPIDIKKANGHAILPDNYPGRAYVNGCRDIESFDKAMQDYDVFITPQELRSLIPYGKDVTNPVNLTKLEEGQRNDTIFRWLARWGRFRGATELDKYAPVIAKIASFPLKEIRNSIKSIDRYMQEDTEYIPDDEIEGNIVGKDLLELTVNVMDYIKRSGFIKYDICTGNYYTTLKLAHKDEMSQIEMWNYFRIYFKDRTRYWTRNKDGEVSFRPVNDVDLKSIFEFVSKHCTFNSREKIYNDIPEWDGVPRIKTFLKKYYDCDAEPNFFLLLMTALVGKLKDPENCYCPFFFDLCGQKGTGKTLLFRRLLGDRFFTTIIPSQREDDVCTNIYSKGAVIALDDECLLTQGKGFSVWSEDKLKSFVTLSEDIFARKYQNVEYHPRGFVLCRTSNFVKSATDTDERRQIIFESKLPARECRIKPDDLPEAFFIQMRAEAKAYYEEHGIYQLTSDDWKKIAAQQANYIDDENIFASEVNEFLHDIFIAIRRDKQSYYTKINGTYFTTWDYYKKWKGDKNQYQQPMSGNLFWKNIRAIGQKTGIVEPTRGRIRLGTMSQVQGAILYPNVFDKIQNLKSAVFKDPEPSEFDQAIEDLPEIPY